MLRFGASSAQRLCNGVSRREFLQIGAASALGISLPEILRAERTIGPASRARSVIVLFLSGGPSQLDTWDLKPDAPAEIRGSFRPIDTRVPGLRVCEHLPRSATVMQHCAVIRSMRHADGNHPSAGYLMMVGHPMTRPAQQSVTVSREDRPHPGSVLAKVFPGRGSMPAFVMIPEAISPVGPERPGQHAGFLGAAFDPYRVNSDPSSDAFSAGALQPTELVTPARLEDRRGLLRRVDQTSRFLDNSAVGQVVSPYYSRAFDMLSSPHAQRAFDLSSETTRTRDRYGRHIFGQSTLLARRLVEAGVRLVQVNWVRHDNGPGGQGYDSHRDHLAWSRDELMPPTDMAFASLIEDLHDRGLLEQTLVLVMGEFGRTPRFNSNAGRDHWPHCFSVVVAGGGVKRGHVHGSSDRIAAQPTSAPVTPQDLHATMYHLLGVDPHQHIHDAQQRPFVLTTGTPVASLIS